VRRRRPAVRAGLTSVPSFFIDRPVFAWIVVGAGEPM
jgi:hypothetical protein